MKFYGRRQELEKIGSYWRLVKKGGSKILVISGRRRIGKTRLILEATQKVNRIYFFVTRKKVTELLRDWSEQVRKELGAVFFGEFTSFEQFLEFLFHLSQQNPLTVIFDEFQNFFYTNPEVYSIFQNQFDQHRESSSLLLLFSGSSFSLMEKIFKGAHEPLFGRAAEIIHLSYLELAAQAEFLQDTGITSQKEKFLLFSIFDGVPKYWEEFDYYKDKLFSTRFRKILMEKDWIWEEGETVLREEFGKDYVSYFSILSAISKGRRILSEIEQYTGISNATVYLKRLEDIYQLIERKVPITDIDKKKSRKGRYYVKDHFFNFWFALMEANRYLKEIGQKSLAIDTIFSKLNQFNGRMLEEMVIRTIIEENPLHWQFTRIGNYWNRKGDIEIDVIVINDLQKRAYFLEVKRDEKKITEKVLSKLRSNSEQIVELAAYEKILGYAYPENGLLKIEMRES